MEKLTYILVLASVLILVYSSEGELRQNGICSWAPNRNSKCPDNTNFRCFNEKCIKRGWYCDGGNDCGDNSDEAYCSYSRECPLPMKKCPGSNKCILTEWFCDGTLDCQNGDDEKNCGSKILAERQRSANIRALRWLEYQKSQLARGIRWPFVDKSAVVFHLTSNISEEKYRKIREEMSYDVTIQLLSRLSKRNMRDISSTDLASYVNAFLVTCLDPRKFHDINIVQELRSRVDSQNYTNPYVLLSLCNAGDTITETDKKKLIDAFWAKRRAFWTDVQALAVMALVCSSRQPRSVVDSETLHELIVELKQHQYRNGTVENLQTTALVLQVLLSPEFQQEMDDFDDAKALQQIFAKQKNDGSFGSFQNTYYAMPVLNCKNLLDISNDHCEHLERDENTALDDLVNRSGPKIRVRYSIWVGNGRDLERNLVLRVFLNTSFYEVMELAGEIDDRFRFEYIVKDRKPYVNVLSGMQDNPEKGTFWFIYTIVDGKATLYEESPADIWPKDNEHIVMWYRSGSWAD